MKSKRIAFVSNTSWYIYNLRLGVIRHLKELGYEILVISPEDTYTHYLISEGYHYIHVKTDNKGRSLLRDFLYFFRLLKIYRTYQPDFIFHYTIKPNIYGALAAKITNIPSIAVVSGAGYTFLKYGILNHFSVLLYRFAMQYAREVWFVNKDDVEEFVAKRIVEQGKVKLLPGEGVNTQHFQPKGRITQTYHKIFLLSARLIWDKGIGIYIDAAKIIKQKYPNTQFNLLGFTDVQNPNSISASQIYEWHEKGYIRYLGKTEDVRPYIADCSCFVLPSYYREGVPRSLLEAAAMAKPIITTDNVGCREVVKNGHNGFLCKVKDVNDLVEKMEKIILTPPAHLEKMGQNGRQMITRQFDEHLVIKEYVQTLEQLCCIKEIVDIHSLQTTQQK
ncbi:MAG: glycosyltransferase family 4 protein [Bacteroidota bacterium]